MSWLDDAACAACAAAVSRGEATLDDWFPEGPSRVPLSLRPGARRALAICRTCPVQSECLTDFLGAFSEARRYGIIGGRIFNGVNEQRIGRNRRARGAA